jgi:Fe-Mn family superoxide dismutase
MAFKLPDLPYDKSALEPTIDARTMDVDNLNKALERYPDLEDYSALSLITNLDRVPEAIRTAVRNNGGGHVNHSMYWLSMSANGGGEPSGKLAEVIAEGFGSFDDFKAEFKAAAMGRFGSGWAWLSVEAEGNFIVMSTANQDNPAMSGQIPLLGLDVWEHAYYLNYQNRRADYVDAWWDVVDWDEIEKNYDLVRYGAKLDEMGKWAGKQWANLEAAWQKLVD